VFIAPSIGQQTAADWLNNGQRLSDQGKYGEAILAYDQSLMLDPQNAEAWYGKGLALWAEGKSDEARSAFEKATTLDPSLSGPETDGTGSIYGPIDGTGSIYGLTPEAKRCADLKIQLEQLTKEEDAVKKRSNSDPDKAGNLMYYSNKIQTVNNQLINYGCKEGTPSDIPSTSGTSSGTSSQPNGLPSTTSGATGPTSDPWEGTWKHKDGILVLKRSNNAMNYLDQTTTFEAGPRFLNDDGTPRSVTSSIFQPVVYAGFLTWNSYPGSNPTYPSSRPLNAAVFAFVDGDKLRARFTTSPNGFRGVPIGIFVPTFQELEAINVAAGGVDIGMFEVKKSDSDHFTGTMTSVKISDSIGASVETPYDKLGTLEFNAERQHPTGSGDANVVGGASSL
jgi:hypothetical protein